MLCPVLNALSYSHSITHLFQSRTSDEYLHQLVRESLKKKKSQSKKRVLEMVWQIFRVLSSLSLEIENTKLGKEIEGPSSRGQNRGQ